jgi:hypothetical protein
MTEALDFDPFQGDFGAPGDRELSDVMRKARKQHECCHCKGPIIPGESYRARADIADGELMQWKWCALCCAAMVSELDRINADDDHDDDAYTFPFEARFKREQT